MKKVTSIILVLLLFLIVGCSKSTTEQQELKTILTITLTSETISTQDVITQDTNDYFYQVSFDSMGGNPLESIYVSKGSNVNLPIPVREGYTFIGWYTGTGPNDTHFSILSTVTFNITLYARWQVSWCTIEFNSNGGSSVDSISAYYNTPISEPSSPEKDGYIFDGWFIDQEFNQEFSFDQMPPNDLILYAKWNLIPEYIMLIIDKGDIDDNAINQAAYAGIREYATELGIDYGYIIPDDATDADYIEAIEQAIADGATVVVTPGFLFETAVNAMQIAYPDIKFITLDANPANVGTLAENTHSIYYAEEQAGFLAGYAAVVEGYRHLGFMGGLAVPAVQRYGHGYIQGIVQAAEDLDIPDGVITVEYLYTGDFRATPFVQAASVAMFNSGVQIIFACGGGVVDSVIAGAEVAGGKVIGFDFDFGGDSKTVITSAIKNFSVSLELALTAIFEDGTWEDDFGGFSVVLGAEVGGIGLPQDFSRFDNFDKADYNTIYAKLVDGTIVVSNVTGQFGDDGTTALQFAGTKIELNIIIFEG